MKKKILPLIFIMLCILLLTLFACGEKMYIVEFYVDGQLYDSFRVEPGGYLETVPEVPKKAGMDGVWSIDDFDEINSDLRVHAIYSTATYVVRFYVDGALFHTSTVMRNSPVTDVPEVPKKAGYSGVWSVVDFSKVDRNIDVEAIYTLLTSEIKFITEGMDTIYRYVPTGEALTDIPDVPIPAGKNYTGKWVATPDGTEDADFSRIDANCEFYAHYYVTLTLTDGMAGKVTECEIDEDIASPYSGVKEGYDFIGWYSDSTFRNKIDFPASFKENDELFARWVSNYSDDGFSFGDGMITGYSGQLTEVTAPYSYTVNGETVIVTGIAEGAFRNSNLVKINLPSTVEIISADAFNNCVVLESVDFVDGSYVTSVGKNAFYNCKSLLRFDFSQFTEVIGEGAFEECTALTEYGGISDATFTVLGNRAFYNNNSLLGLTLPDTLEEIGDYALYNLAGVDIKFGNAEIRKVGAYAFGYCTGLFVFRFETLEEIGDKAFIGCASLSCVTMPSDRKLFELFGNRDEGENFYSITYMGVRYYLPISLYNLVITPSSDGILITDALYNAFHVKNVTLVGVTEIAERAFRMVGVTATDTPFSITFSNNLRVIGDDAFEGRDDLRKLAFPSSLQSIGARAFYGISNLGSGSVNDVTIGDNNALTHVGESAFKGTAFLAEYYGVARLGRIALGATEKFLSVSGQLTASDFNGIDTIATWAFADNTALRVATLPDTVVNIGDGAFSGAKNLTELRIGRYATVGESILDGCSSVTTLRIGARLTVEQLFGTTSYPFMTRLDKDGESYYISPSLRKLVIEADGTAEIGAYRYSGFDNLTEIEISDGILRISDAAFADNGALFSVKFPSSVTDIGYTSEDDYTYVGVFKGCTRLTEVTLSEGLRVIHPLAFAATSVSSVNIPSTVIKIGESAFDGAKIASLTFAGNNSDELVIGKRAFANGGYNSYTLTFPSRLVEIGEEAFAENGGLVGIIFNDNLTSLGKRAFADSGIFQLTIPESIKIYDDDGECLVTGAFENNPVSSLTLYTSVLMTELFITAPTTLTSVTVNHSQIADRQFRGVTSLRNVTLNDVQTIGDSAFYGNVNLTRILLPRTLSKIGDMAFAECTMLENIIIPDNSFLEEIGEYAFSGDINLLAINLSASLNIYSLKGTFNGCVSLAEVNIPTRVHMIEKDTFRDCRSLTSITVPDNVFVIGDYAFYGCENLVFDNVRFAKLEYIDDYAFAGCRMMDGIKAENIVRIGAHAFDDCVNLQEITVIDKPVTYYIADAGNIIRVNVSVRAATVASNLLQNCDNVKRIMLYSTHKLLLPEMIDSLTAQSIGDNVKLFVTADAYAKLDSSYKALVSPNPSEINGEYVLDKVNGNAKLVSASFDGSELFLPSYVYDKDKNEYAVTEIGREVFRGNTTIREVIVPYTVKKIGDYAFANTNIEHITFEIGSWLETIGSEAFKDCRNLSELAIPDSLEVIGDGAFYNASSLRKFTMSTRSRLTSIGENAFGYTTSLEGVEFNGIIEEIGARAFEYSGIAFLKFGGNVRIREIKEYTFASCRNLTRNNVILPQGVAIDKNAFYNTNIGME